MSHRVGNKIPPRPRVYKDGNVWRVRAGWRTTTRQSWRSAMTVADEFADKRRELLRYFLECGKKFRR